MATDWEQGVYDELRTIAKLVERAAGDGVGFAIFLEAGGMWTYASNADRADVVKLLDEWLGLMELRGIQKETSTHVDERLALERRCAEIGKKFAKTTRVCIFLFTFGDNGSLAYFTNVTDPRPNIRTWIASERGRS